MKPTSRVRSFMPRLEGLEARLAPSAAPTLDPIPTQYVVEGGVLSFQAKGQDPDAGQKLAYSLGAGAPAGAAIDPTTGVFRWAVGDGPTSASAIVVVKDPTGRSGQQTVQITVRNEPPTGRLAASGQLVVGSLVAFSIISVTDLSAADRAAGYRYSFDWNDDGDFTDPGEVADGKGYSVSRAFAAPGTYTVHGRVKDKDGGARDYRTTVTLANTAPTLAPIPTQYVVEDRVLTFQAKGTDQPGQRLTYSLLPGAPAGATIDPATGVFRWTAGDGPTSATVRILVKDPYGLSAQQAVQINVRNEPPTARFVSSGRLQTGSPVAFSFLDVTDLAAVDRSAGYRYSFDWNDDGDFTDPGEVADGKGHSVSRAFAAPGTYTVHGRVKDKDGGARDYRVMVAITQATNTAPTLDPIATQYVPETRALTFRAVGRDANAGQKLTYSLAAGAPLGARIDPNTGVFTWAAPDGPYNASVVVRVTDAGGLSATRTVPVVVRNEPPTARFVSSGQLQPGAPVTFSFLDVTDLSATDRSAGYRYSFDWNNDGDFTDPGEASDGTLASRARTFAAAGTYTVHGRVKDKDGGSSEYRLTVTIRVPATTAGPGRVIDLVPGSGSSAPSQLTAIGQTLYFVATTPSTGEELWRSDGTAAGTRLVRDITPGPGGSLPRNLTEVNGVLYFTAQDPDHGVELWRTDGTAAGTRLVKDIYPGIASAWPAKLMALNGVLYFTAYTPAHGVELWRSDSSDAGTQLVIDLTPGSGSGSPDQLTRIGSSLAFVGNRPDVGGELWRTNGTAAGTVLIRDINPGRGSSFIAGLLNAAGTMYFSAFTPQHGQELWKSDATGAGTVLVKDIAAGNESSSPSGLTALGARVFFTPSHQHIGSELWGSDGTADGTRLLADIIPGLESSVPSYLTVYNGAVYFAAAHGAIGVELWRSDGTTPGTYAVSDVQPGSASSTPESLVVSGGYLWFAAWTSARGVEVWRTDGTPAGTKSLSTLYPGVRPAFPSSLVDVRGKLFFVAFEPGYGYELWTSSRT